MNTMNEDAENRPGRKGRRPDVTFRLLLDGEEHDVVVSELTGSSPYDLNLRILLDGTGYEVGVETGNEAGIEGRSCRCLRTAGSRARADGETTPPRAENLVAPMPGTVLSVAVVESGAVERGDLLVLLDAMKMQNELRAAGSGRVRKIHCREGDNVAHGDLLVEFE